jgi:hypothetical protein
LLDVRSGASEFDLPGMPPLDFRSQPKARSTAARIEGRLRHVRIPVEVEAHSVPMGEAEDPRDVVRVCVVARFGPGFASNASNGTRASGK